jgi:hypothetical protein
MIVCSIDDVLESTASLEYERATCDDYRNFHAFIECQLIMIEVSFSFDRFLIGTEMITLSLTSTIYCIASA